MARTELEVCKHDLDRLEVDLRVQNDENKRLKVTWVVKFKRERDTKLARFLNKNLQMYPMKIIVFCQ